MTGLVKDAGWATNFLNRSDDSPLIRWETCFAEIVRMEAEFEDSLVGDTSVYHENQHKHHEESAQFQKQFSTDVQTLYSAFPKNPFQYEKVARFDNPVQRVSDNVIEYFKRASDLGEEQYISFFKDRLINRKALISDPIKRNNIFFWDTSTVEESTLFTPPPSAFNKLRCAVIHRSKTSEEVFNNELYGILHCFAKNSTSLYQGTKSDILTKFSLFSTDSIDSTNGKSAIVIEMSPIIKAAAVSGADSVDTCSDFSFLVYSQVLRKASQYDRWDLVFD